MHAACMRWRRRRVAFASSTACAWRVTQTCSSSSSSSSRPAFAQDKQWKEIVINKIEWSTCSREFDKKSRINQHTCESSARWVVNITTDAQLFNKIHIGRSEARIVTVHLYIKRYSHGRTKDRAVAQKKRASIFFVAAVNLIVLLYIYLCRAREFENFKPLYLIWCFRFCCSFIRYFFYSASADSSLLSMICVRTL